MEKVAYSRPERTCSSRMDRLNISLMSFGHMIKDKQMSEIHIVVDSWMDRRRD